LIYAVIDTNILISALLAKHENSPPVQILKKIFSGEIIPLYSKEILDEYHHVLRREKFSFSETSINTMLGTIEQNGVLVKPTTTGEILPDIKDMPFYEVVQTKQNEEVYLITGNIKHFPENPYTVTARQLLDILV
jgi:putative PIN family toxin of toxin-antitoxin system